MYHKQWKNSNTVIILKFELCGYTKQSYKYAKDADGMTNSVNPDQTVLSGSTCFAQTCLSDRQGMLL